MLFPFFLDLLQSDERQDLKLYDVMTTPITDANKQYLGGAFATLKSTSSTMVIAGNDSCKDQVEVTILLSMWCYTLVFQCHHGTPRTAHLLKLSELNVLKIHILSIK